VASAGLSAIVLRRTVFSKIRVSRWLVSPFKTSGYTGVMAAVAVTVTLVGIIGLSEWMLAVIVPAALSTFLVLVYATKIFTGEERIIYYHHEIGVMIVSALLLRALRQPLLPYLDITILGIGTFLTFGRIGCLLVGCCHGRPCRWGVRYGEDHAAAGFPSYLVGVRLFPIQAVESLWTLCTVLVGTFFVWTGSVPGTALAWYVIVYGLGRFFFEFARGDADRSYWLGFSQPQWLSLLLIGGVVRAELSGYLPSVRWHIGVFGFLVVTMIGVSAKRRMQKSLKFQLLHARHIQEVAGALDALCTSEGESEWQTAGQTVVAIASTSLGIRISGGEIGGGDGHVCHYAFSSRGSVLTERSARTLADLVRRLKNTDGHAKLIAGGQGVFHLLIWAM
jgi:prolipoprotein diacylglyceryltransferase